MSRLLRLRFILSVQHRQVGRLSVNAFHHCHTQNFAYAWLLHEGHYPEIGRIGARLEFYTKIPVEALSFFQLANFRDVLHNGDVA